VLLHRQTTGDRECCAPASLHLSVFLHIAADLFEWVELRSSSGLVTIIAIAAYAGTLVAASRNIRAAVRVR
jgi:hypothetical protein